jgi:disulfide bond formation protein DsbB
MNMLKLNYFLNKNLIFALLYLFLTPIFLVLFAIYLEVYEGLAPCPLCTIQRGEYLFISFSALMGLLFNKYRIISSIFIFISFVSAFLGLLTAGRHIQLQYMDPNDVPSCGPDLAYMLEALPIFDTFKTVFTGSGSCADVSWSFLYLTIPEWAAIWFLSYIVLSASLISVKMKTNIK